MKRLKGRAFSAIIAAALAHIAPASAAGCDVTVAERAVATAVAPDGTLALADGRHLRLATIQLPRVGETQTHEARAAVTALVAGKTLDLGFADRGADRHGNLLAYAFIGGDWLQAHLVRDGHARVAPRTDMRRCARELLIEEATARAAKRGLWANDLYRVRQPTELNADIGTFQIVEGKVLSVKTNRDRTFLNFGPDYRTDFTVTIPRSSAKRMIKEGADPSAWNGKTIRVRGWLTRLNGPEIEVTTSEQVEVVE